MRISEWNERWVLPYYLLLQLNKFNYLVREFVLRINRSRGGSWMLSVGRESPRRLGEDDFRYCGPFACKRDTTENAMKKAHKRFPNYGDGESAWSFTSRSTASVKRRFSKIWIATLTGVGGVSGVQIRMASIPRTRKARSMCSAEDGAIRPLSPAHFRFADGIVQTTRLLM